MSARRVMELATVAATVFVLCWFSLAFSRDGSVLAAIWPTNAVVVAYILRRAASTRAATTAAVVAGAAMLAANLAVGRGLILSVGFPLANLLEIAAATWVMRGVNTPLTRPSDYLRLVGGAAFAAPLLGGLAAACLAAIQDPAANIGESLLRWAAADGLGMAILLPFALTVGPGWTRIVTDRRRLAASLACQLAVAAASWFVFFWAQMPFMMLVVPFVMVAVFVNRDLGAAVSLATVACFSLAAAFMHTGGMVQVADVVGRDPMLVAQFAVAALVLTVQPVTAVLARLDAAMAELEERRWIAEAQSERKTKLLAHVSHEIRTPLSGVVTLAEMMRQGALGELTTRQRDFVGRIADSGAEIEALSRDLLDTAAIQAGKATLRQERVEVAAALADAVAASAFRTRDLKAIVEVGTVDPGLVVEADGRRLRQMLMNLIVNGAKYGGRPALVRVSAEPCAWGAVRFAICDNGSGVPLARRKEIFNAFERSGAEQSAMDGSGVGLALVRELAELQGGRVGVEDGALGGACFWIELPRADAGARAA